MKSKYLASYLATIILGFGISAEKAMADVIVKWQAGDNAVNIQKAIDSGDDTIIIPKAEKTWLVGETINLKRPNQKIIFKPGVVVAAKKGGFQDVHGPMFRITADNVTLSGYKATLRMRKADYLNPDLYKPSPYRHILSIRGVKNFVVEGLTFKNSGGDAIFVSHGQREKNQLPARKYSSGIVRDVVATNSHRLGMSIMSAQGLLVENSVFEGSSGTRPASGVDIEPDYPWQKLSGIKFNNTQFLNNQRNGIQISLGKYHGTETSTIDISFNNCSSIGNREIGIKIFGSKVGYDNGAKGIISFNDMQIENTGQDGIWYKNDQLKPSDTFQVVFDNTEVTNVARRKGEFYPVTLWNTINPGGTNNIDFGDDFVIRDNKERPGLFTNTPGKKDGFNNISGTIEIKNPVQQPSDLGSNLKNFTLEFR